MYPPVGGTLRSHTNIDWLQPSVSSLLSPSSHAFSVAQFGAESLTRTVRKPIDSLVD
jgi:hypothetical protein